MLQTIKVFVKRTPMKAIQPIYCKRYAFITGISMRFLLCHTQLMLSSCINVCYFHLYRFTAIPLYIQINQMDDQVNCVGHYSNVTFTSWCEWCNCRIRWYEIPKAINLNIQNNMNFYFCGFHWFSMIDYASSTVQPFTTSSGDEKNKMWNRSHIINRTRLYTCDKTIKLYTLSQSIRNRSNNNRAQSCDR